MTKGPRIIRTEHTMPVVVHERGNEHVEQREARFVEISVHLFERESKPIVTIKPVALADETIVEEKPGVWHSYPRRKR